MDCIIGNSCGVVMTMVSFAVVGALTSGGLLAAAAPICVVVRTICGKKKKIG